MKKWMLVVSAFLLFSCNSSKVDQKAEGEKVMQLSREWSQAATSRNVEKTLDYWADNAVVMSAGQPVLRGKQEIRNMIEESFRMPGFRISWQPQSVEVSESGDMAYLLENSQINITDSTGKPITLHNKAVTIWRKQADGSWKNIVDIATPASLQDK